MNDALSFVGMAYLLHAEQHEDRYIARLGIIPSPSSSQPDDISINCEVNDQKLQDFLQRMRYQLIAGNKVILKFTATDIRFAHCHYGQTTNDPSAMVQFTGRLNFIAEWQIEEAKNHSTLANNIKPIHFPTSLPQTML